MAGGGTAGHVNPLLAVADSLRERDPSAQILVLGTREGLEARLVPLRGYELLFVDKVPFPRRPNRAAFAFPAKYRGAISHVRSLLRERAVDVVVGFGGYAAAPAYVAARREKVPFVVHEANAKPGLANRLGARRATAVGVAFEGTPLARSTVVGMPLRREIVDLDRDALRNEAADFFGLDPKTPTLLVFGGSLGALRLNTAFGDAANAVPEAGWQILHVTGERSELPDPEIPGYALRRYVDRMDLAFAMADVIVSRSGAATVSEIGALGIPAVYVPYAVGNGEQALNASASVRAGAAIIIPDAEFTGECVRTVIVPLLHDDARVERMRTAASRVGTRRGSENFIELIDASLRR
nr:UDP-N-acetylglucosamine--N-acetylmuramyl-(pentapeptide) pyrophosphoryl-undecaprenol N-acetylglucosamine transferase [Microbacterium halimionae]